MLKQRTGLAIVLVGFVALGIFYSLVVPIFEGPDEDDHFRYARFLAEQRTLPIQLFQPGGGVAGHQGWQPPLYYALAAMIIAPIDTSDYEQHLWRNNAVTFVGDPSCCGRNIYYHTDSENFPFTRTTLAVHLARLLSILFGAITVVATYKLADTLLDSSPFAIRGLIPLAAAAFVAFNPSFLFSSALVSNDTALAAFCALALLMWIQWLTEKRTVTWQNAGLLGAIIGLALLTKTTALGLIPFSVLVLGVIAWRKRDWKMAIAGNAVMLATMALIAGWWFVRNTVLYGDPLALRLVNVSALFPRAGPLTLPELFQISLPWLWQTFWGGPTPGDFSPVILVALAVLSLLAAVGTIVFVIRNPTGTLRSSPFAIRASILILAAWLGFILIAQTQFIRTTIGADQGRYLFPAIGVLALFFVVGLNEWFNRLATRITHHVSRICHLSFIHLFICHWLIGSFFALALFVPFAYTLPAYARPALASADDLVRVAHPLQINFADQIELRGYALDTRSVKPGDSLQVTLYWRARAPMNESYRVFVQLIGVEDRSAGGVDVIPARGAFPTVYWKPGDALRDVVEIPIAANTAPGKYAIQVGLYPVGKPGDRLTVLGTDDDHVVISAIKVAPRENEAFDPRTRLDANFGNLIDLMGYDSDLDQNVLRLSLYWRAHSAMDDDYTVFVHVLDANGKIIAQVDQPPQAGNYPTSLWDKGEQVRDDYTLPLPGGALSGHRIEIGLYRADSGVRLQTTSGDHVVITLPGASP